MLFNHIHWSFPGGLAVKSLPSNAGYSGSIPGSGRSPAEGNGYPLQSSCLENPTTKDREFKKMLLNLGSYPG